jgi:cysteine desulfurase family protein (TIGR01976 family)
MTTVMPRSGAVRGGEMISREAIRAMYPALESATAFLDNAGGSQLPGVVIEAMTRYLRESYVQLGADYAVSVRATATVAAAHRFVKRFMNAAADGEVILGASTSQLVFTLAQAHARVLKAGDEIIISEASHESNVGAWANMGQEDGARPVVVVKLWRVDRRTGEPDVEHLKELLSPRTKLVCFPHVSNVFGHVADVAGITRLVHDRGARVLVDGVAYAPHRAIDVSAWGVDWYVYSTYKVFGPHMAAVFGSREALAPLTGPNHFFIPKTELPRKFELGGVSHEGAAGILALDHFLRDVAGEARLADVLAPDARFDHGVAKRAFDMMERLEAPLFARLIEFLKTKRGVRIIGPSDGQDRVGIVSFVREGKSSKSIAQAGNARGLGFRFGNFYAYRLCQAIGLDPADGVVRVSFCHYNTMDEVERLIGFLDEALG